MKKKVFMIAAAMTLMLGCTMTVHAEPVEVVPGVMFDAEYYAKNNPDVTAVMGTDAGALFNHYVLLGQAEGRLPYDVGQTVTAGPATAETPAALSYGEQVVKLVNEERAKAGLSALSVQSNVTTAANIRAKEQVQLYSHTRPDGRNFVTALNEQGITNRYMGENITYGQTSPEMVMDSWMSSPVDRTNILNGNYKYIGVGHYVDGTGTNYWVQLFLP